MEWDEKISAELCVAKIEADPPPLLPALDVQIETLLLRMRPMQAVVLPAAAAYLVLVKGLGMGVGVVLRHVPGSDTHLRVYKLVSESFETHFPRASVR